MPTLSSLMKSAEDEASVMLSEMDSEAAKAAREEAKAVSFAQIMAAIQAKADGAINSQVAIQQLAQRSLGSTPGAQQQ